MKLRIKALAMSNQFIKSINAKNSPKNMCRGQGYDNVDNMKRKFGGVQ